MSEHVKTLPDRSLSGRRGAWSIDAGLDWLAFGVFVFVILLHAGLLPMGSWRVDDYSMLAGYRTGGFGTFLGRVLHWSPRPFSELLIYVYSLLVSARGTPSIAIALGACWCFWLALSFWSAGGRRAGRPELVVWGAVCAFCLLSGSIQEVFYWPMGTLAYLPAVTGLLVVALAVAWGGPGDARGRRVVLLGLLLAAASNEIGASFTMLASLGLACVDLASRQRRRAILWLLPELEAVCVLVLVWRGRISQSDEKQVDSPLYHHAWASARAAVGQMASSFRLDQPLVVSIAVILLVFSGFRLLLGPMQRTNRLAGLVCLAAMVATMVLIAFAADYREGGSFPWGRYGTMSRCIAIGVVLVAAAVTAGQVGRVGRRLAPVALLLATLLLLVGRAPNLLESYAHVPARLATSAANWRAGHSAGPVLRMSPVQDDAILGRLWLPPGDYRNGNMPGYAQSILRYFNKRELILAPD